MTACTLHSHTLSRAPGVNLPADRVVFRSFELGRGLLDVVRYRCVAVEVDSTRDTRVIVTWWALTGRCLGELDEKAMAPPPPLPIQ